MLAQQQYQHLMQQHYLQQQLFHQQALMMQVINEPCNSRHIQGCLQTSGRLYKVMK